MSRFFSEKFKSLDPYVPGEQPRDMKYVKLNTNESPYPPSPEVLASMSPENAKKLRLYPDPESAALKDAIGKAEGLGRENVYVANGKAGGKGVFSGSDIRILSGLCGATRS